MCMCRVHEYNATLILDEKCAIRDLSAISSRTRSAYLFATNQHRLASSV